MAGMMRSQVGKVATNIGAKLRDKLLGQLQQGADQAIDSLGTQALNAGQKLLTGPSMGSVAAAAKGADIVMAELVPAAKQAEVVMAELVPAATAATTATTGLGASLSALAPAAGIAAVAAVVLLPILAAIDDVTGGTLSESGYYPEWLKKIGEAMLLFSGVGPVIKAVVVVFQELWAVVKELFELFSNLAPIILGPVKLAFDAVTFVVTTAIKVAFFPLHAALFALNAPFRAVHLAVDAIKGVFSLAQTAVERFVAGLRALPGVAASAVMWMGRMAASAASTAAGFVSSAWGAAMSSIRAIGSGLQTAGKTLAIVGGGMAALGGVIVAPLANLAAGRWQEAADGAMGVVEAAFWRVMQVADDVWQQILSISDSLWTGLQDGFDVAMTAIEKVWISSLDVMKRAAATMMEWTYKHVVSPMSDTLSSIAKYDPTGFAGKVSGAVQNARDNLGESITRMHNNISDNDVDKAKAAADERRDKRSEDRKKAAADRQDSRDTDAAARRDARNEAIAAAEQRGRSPEGQLSRSDFAGATELTNDWQKDVDAMWEAAAKKAERMTMMENNPTLYDAEKRLAAEREWEAAHKRATEEDKRLEEFKAGIKDRMGPVAQAQAGADEAARARDEAIERARQLREEMTRPDDPDKPDKDKKHSGFVTTSAYAFGQFGSGDPQRDQLAELKKARQEAADERKQRDKDWAELLRWQKLLGTKDAAETRETLFDLMT